MSATERSATQNQWKTEFSWPWFSNQGFKISSNRQQEFDVSYSKISNWRKAKNRKSESNLRCSHSLSPLNTKTKDKKGRDKIQWSLHDPLEMFLYGQRNFNSTSTLHYRHLKERYNKWKLPLNKGPSSSHPLPAIINIVDLIGKQSIWSMWSILANSGVISI